MKPIVFIYHSVLGIRGSELNLSEVIKKEGFDVIIPDLYEGKKFDDYKTAMAFLGTFGEDGLEKKAYAMFEEEHKKNGKKPVIFIGFSNGCNLAEWLSLKISETVGTILLHGGMPVKMFGYEGWPSNLPIQIHYSKEDPWKLEDEEILQEFLNEIENSGAKLEFYEYEGEGHLFSDPELLLEYNDIETQNMYEKVKGFLSNF